MLNKHWKGKYFFFGKSLHFKLALPQAAWLSMNFTGKSEVLHLYEGPDLRTHYWLDREEKKKAQHLEGFKPTNSRVLLRRRVLYRWATTPARVKVSWGVSMCSDLICWEARPSLNSVLSCWKLKNKMIVGDPEQTFSKIKTRFNFFPAKIKTFHDWVERSQH